MPGAVLVFGSVNRTPIRTILARGIRGKCPRCGGGDLFVRWVVAHERCAVCHLLYQRNYGDIWMFTNIMDRLPIFFGIVALFFGFRVLTFWSGVIFITALTIPMVATIKHRQGLALALDYLVRLHSKDPSDEIHGGRELSQSEAAELTATRRTA